MRKQYQYYFAYGSNMDVRQMAHRCPDAKKVGPSLAICYRFAIDSAGVATIIPDTRSYVEGVLWKVSTHDIERLDVYEGVRNGCYYKKEISICTKKGDLLEALVYISNRSERPVGFSTASPYMDRILLAAQREGLRPVYLETLKAYAGNHNACVTV